MTSITLNALVQVNIFLSLVIAVLAVLERRKLRRYCSVIVVANAGILMLIFGVLIYLFVLNHFEYFHVWSHSASGLSSSFKVAAIWEGQEGSLFLWAFFQNFISLYFLLQKKRELRVAGSVLLIWQVLLLLPVTDFGFHDPVHGLFVQTRQELQLDTETLQAKWLLRDGKGMNPLLQNFWMVVHPPVIFLAFAFSSVPYALCLAGMFFRHSFPIRNISSWLKYSLITLSAGILMGAYWAYETLNFGGYWSWDPVENAIYLPWLIGLAGLHSNWLAARNEGYVRLSYALNCLYFLFIVYATFLTRSGVLSGISVHSFVDSGYYSYFLSLLVAVAVAAIVPVILRRSKFAGHKLPLLSFCRSDYAFLVTLVLMLAALQIFISVSIPVFSRWSSDMGFLTQAAPVSDPGHYSRWQGGWAMVMLSLLITAEWKGNIKTTAFLVTFPLLILLGASRLTDFDFAMAGVILALGFLLLGALLFKSVKPLFTTDIPVSTLAHTGFVVLLIGVVFSNNILTSGSTGQHTLLVYGESKPDGKSTFMFDGKYRETDDGHLISAGLLKKTSRPDRFIAKDSILLENRMIAPGEVIRIEPRDFYFKICRREEENLSTFFSMVHFNSETDYFITPEIHHGLFSDLYFHISNISNDEEIEWKEYNVADVAAGLKPEAKSDLNPDVVLLKSIPGMTLGEGEVAYMIRVVTNYKGKEIILAPLVVVGKNEKLVFSTDDANETAGIAVDIVRWEDPQEFSLKFYSTEPGYITILAEEKPFVNFFWIGGFLIILGLARSVPVGFRWSFRIPQALREGLPVFKIKKGTTHEDIKNQSAQGETV